MSTRIVLAALAAAVALSGCQQGSTGGTTSKKASEAPATSTTTQEPSTMTPAPTNPGTPAAGGADTVTTASGLKYFEVAVGDGPLAEKGMSVSVHYTGWLTDRTRPFDSSLDRGQPFEFPLGGGRVIRGWDEGVAGMRVGGTRQLIIPPDLGYGAAGAGGTIPPNATLIFEVKLLGIK